MLDIFLTLAGTLRSVLTTREDLLLENLALRHQLAVLIRSDRRVRFRVADRLLWISLRQLWAKWKEALVLVQPSTVLCWHREGFRKSWHRKSRRPPGRPRVDRDIRALCWGAGRSHKGDSVNERAFIRPIVAAAIGFTVALFFATAAFPEGSLLDQAKMGALLSFVAAPLAGLAALALRVGRRGNATG